MKPKTIVTIVLLAFVAVSAIWLIANEVNKPGVPKTSGDSNQDPAAGTEVIAEKPLVEPIVPQTGSTVIPSTEEPKPGDVESKPNRKADNAYVIAYYLHTTRR